MQNRKKVLHGNPRRGWGTEGLPDGRGYVRLDMDRVDALLRTRGVTREEFIARCHVDARTLTAAFQGKQCQFKTVRSIGEELQVEDLSQILQRTWPSTTDGDSSTVGEWDREQVLTPWITTSNGLQFHVCRLRHRYVPDRLARGKCYELQHLSTKERERVLDHLQRHPQTCDRLGNHPRFPVNLGSHPAASHDRWWVIDQWVEGTLLSDRLSEPSLEPSSVPPLLRGIGEGLEAMHAVGILRRELSPRFILVREDDGRPVLTDLELCKLLDGSPTVSQGGGWQLDPYRAPEVGGDTLDARADVYSWGRIATHAVTGQLPKQGAEADVLQAAKLPSAVAKTLLSCVAIIPDERPHDMSAVLAAIRKWK